MKDKLAEKPKSTIKQKRLAKKLVEAVASDISITGGELLKSAGYSEWMARNPSDALNAPGVQAELNAMGFTEAKAKEVVSMILSDTEEKGDTRLKAAEIVFKVHGTYAPERSINVTLAYKPDPKIIKVANEYEKKLDKLLDDEEL